MKGYKLNFLSFLLKAKRQKSLAFRYRLEKAKIMK